MASNPPFVLMRATVEDMDDIVNLNYLCFPDFIRQLFMGAYSEADIPRVTKEVIKEMQHDPSDIWLYVKDLESGKIIAACEWKIYMNRRAAVQNVQQPPPW